MDLISDAEDDGDISPPRLHTDPLPARPENRDGLLAGGGILQNDQGGPHAAVGGPRARSDARIKAAQDLHHALLVVSRARSARRDMGVLAQGERCGPGQHRACAGCLPAGVEQGADHPGFRLVAVMRWHRWSSDTYHGSNHGGEKRMAGAAP